LNRIKKLVSCLRRGLWVDAAARNRLWLYRVFQLGAVKVSAKSLGRALMVLAWIVTTSAWAADGYVYDAAGDVSIGIGKNAPRAAIKNDAIPSDTVVNTGDKSYAVLEFKDGQIAIMQANTAFHVDEYHYDPKRAGKSNVDFSKFTGGMRFITGLIGQRNHEAFRLSTPNATIDTRGTEFMAVTVNDTLYSQVISGSISMTNKAGAAVFTAGQTILVASLSTLPTAIPATALPAGVFSQLEAIPTPPGIADNATAETGVATADTTTVTPPPGEIPAASATPTPASSKTAKRNAVAADGYFLCDFCTGPTHDATHIATTADAATGNAVTGDAALFGKHNLTPTGANTGEICAFCHTPQGSESGVASPPLWNRTAPPLSGYRAYSSMGSATNEASGSVSMSCLSCHDGTQAPNIIINTPDNRLNVPYGEMVNTGNDLKNHHPVGMPYGGGGQNQNAPDIPPDPVAAYTQLADFNKFTSLDGNKFTFFNRRGVFKRNDTAAFNDIGNFSKAGSFDSPKGGFNKSTYSGTGNGTVWWIETPNSKNGRQKTDLYLFTRTDKIDSIPSESTLNQPYVECATCHDPHSTNPTFLRLPGGNARSQVCLSCHNK
jgi:predicted CXXCH cytochrome family protein